MKIGKIVYVVMVNDVVDSIWDDQSKACIRGDELHNPSPENIEDHPMFARTYPFKLNKKGHWNGEKT